MLPPLLLLLLLSTGQGSFPCDDACIPDTINNAHIVRDLYEMSNDTTGADQL